MVFTPPRDKTKEEKTYKIIEIVVHLVFIFAIPAIFLEVTTEFDKYALPDFIIYVYGYWLTYLILTPIFYSRFKKRKPYKKFRRK